MACSSQRWAARRATLSLAAVRTRTATTPPLPLASSRSLPPSPARSWSSSSRSSPLPPLAPPPFAASSPWPSVSRREKRRGGGGARGRGAGQAGVQLGLFLLCLSFLLSFFLSPLSCTAPSPLPRLLQTMAAHCPGQRSRANQPFLGGHLVLPFMPFLQSRQRWHRLDTTARCPSSALVRLSRVSYFFVSLCRRANFCGLTRVPLQMVLSSAVPPDLSLRC